MSLIGRIISLSERAESRLEAARQWDSVGEIQTLLDISEQKLPLTKQGVVFHEEGAETTPIALETVELGLALPASQVSWDLRTMPYRIYVRVAQPALIKAVRRDGTVLFENRRIFQDAVVDVDFGDVTLSSTAPITELHLARYTARGTGEFVIGPFTGHAGFVSVTPVGYGDWTAEVAYDSYIEGSFTDGVFTADASPAELMSETRTIVAAPGGYTTTPVTGAEPWSVAARSIQPRPVLNWTTEIPVGIVGLNEDAADTTLTTTTGVDPTAARYWAQLSTWIRFSLTESPARTDLEGWWTYVWGTATVDAPAEMQIAYDMKTGRQVSEETVGAASGAYLICVYATTDAIRDSAVTVTGMFGAGGGELLLQGDPRLTLDQSQPQLLAAGDGWCLPAGTYRKVPTEAHNDRFLIRVKGTGQIRALDIKVRQTVQAPGSEEIVTVYRESLAPYFDAHQHPPAGIVRSGGTGVFMPAT